MNRIVREVHQCQCAICAAGEDEITEATHRQINVLLSQLNEVQRRWYGGSLSQQVGGPSDRELMRITGLDAKTIRRGRRELRSGLWRDGWGRANDGPVVVDQKPKKR